MSAFNFLHEWANAPWVLTDPGDAGALPIAKSGIVPMVSAAAETRTLARPAREGLILMPVLHTDGGTVTLTVTGDVGALTYADEGDWAVLFSYKDNTALEWGVLGSKGVGGLSLADAINIAIADSGAFTAQTEVEGALQEIYQHILSAQGEVFFPIGAFQEQDGTALADFVDGASTTPGWSAGDEGFGIRWNNHANPDPISSSIPIPIDLDNSANATLKIVAAKIGATLADAVTWTCELFNNVVGALYDADADYGGASSAMTGDSATKTVQQTTLTLTAANLPVAATGGSICLTIQPTDGTLGTDDVILLGVRMTYKRKLLTS